MKEKELVIRIKRHEGIVIAFVAIIILMYVGEAQADAGNCTKKNPQLDCSQRGTIELSQITPYNFTQTTGLGTHYVNGIPSLEFRGTNNNQYGNFQHVVCDNGNTTCSWHLDKYPALDFPLGTVLHLSDFLTLSVGLLSEDLWQLTIWIIIVTVFYFVVKTIEERFF